MLDDIQIDYENDPAECEATSTTPSWSSSKSANQQKSSISQQQVSSNSIQQAKSPKQTSGFGGIKVVKSQGKGKAREDESLAAGIRRSNGGVSDSFVVNENNKESIDDGTETAEIVDGGRNGGVDGRTSSSSSSSAAAINSKFMINDFSDKTSSKVYWKTKKVATLTAKKPVHQLERCAPTAWI